MKWFIACIRQMVAQCRSAGDGNNYSLGLLSDCGSNPKIGLPMCITDVKIQFNQYNNLRNRIGCNRACKSRARK